MESWFISLCLRFLCWRCWMRREGRLRVALVLVADVAWDVGAVGVVSLVVECWAEPLSFENSARAVCVCCLDVAEDEECGGDDCHCLFLACL